jgi:hypothetical protein
VRDRSAAHADIDAASRRRPIKCANEVERRRPRSPRQLIHGQRTRVMPIDQLARRREIRRRYFFISP